MPPCRHSFLSRYHRSRCLFAIFCLIICSTASAQTPPSEAPPTLTFDKDRLYLQRITDLRPLSLEGGDEREPFEDVLLHANQFTPDQLAAGARKDLTLNELLDEKQANRDMVRMELVQIKGKLKRLKRLENLARLREAGIENLYEAWIFPHSQRGNDPVCIIISEPPVGVEPDDDITPGVEVSTAGYYFKVLEYKSNQPNPNDPNRTLFRRAPVLLGKAIEVLPEPTPANASISDLATISIVFGGILIAVLLGLTVWLRRSDTGARQMKMNRLRNPYASTADIPSGGEVSTPPTEPN